MSGRSTNSRSAPTEWCSKTARPRSPNGTQSNKLADLSRLKTAIVQVGYERNKAGYKFTEIEDALLLFKVAQQIWKAEVGGNNQITI